MKNLKVNLSKRQRNLVNTIIVTILAIIAVGRLCMIANLEPGFTPPVVIILGASVLIFSHLYLFHKQEKNIIGFRQKVALIISLVIFSSSFLFNPDYYNNLDLPFEEKIAEVQKADSLVQEKLLAYNMLMESGIFKADNIPSEVANFREELNLAQKKLVRYTEMFSLNKDEYSKYEIYSEMNLLDSNIEEMVKKLEASESDLKIAIEEMNPSKKKNEARDNSGKSPIRSLWEVVVSAIMFLAPIFLL